MISIALGSVVYFWSCRNQQNVVVKAAEKRDEDFYCSVKWNPSGSLIGLGSDYGCLQVMESSTCSSVWTYSCHEERISSVSWMNDYVFSTGSRDNSIKTFDLRSNQRSPIALMNKHQQEVCGLKWSPHGGLLASGGNDNIIHVWDSRK